MTNSEIADLILDPSSGFEELFHFDTKGNEEEYFAYLTAYDVDDPVLLRLLFNAHHSIRAIYSYLTDDQNTHIQN